MSENGNAMVATNGNRPAVAMGSRGVQLRTLEEAFRFATAVHRSGMAPKSLRSPEAVLIAMQHGAEVGLTPMAALQNIAVVNGRPCLWGDGLKAVVEASPLCESIVERTEGQGESLVAICEAKRKGRPEPTVARFSWADAKRAGLTGKDTYKQYPARMLQMRARSWALRDAFADLLCGLSVAEEVETIAAPERLHSGDVAPADDLDGLAAELGEEPASEPPSEPEGPTVEELVASGEYVPAEDAGVGRLFEDGHEDYA